MTKNQRIRDPLHNLIVFDIVKKEQGVSLKSLSALDKQKHLDRILWQLINSRPLQRLRRIKQLGFSDIVYPGAVHSRFAHSLGAMQTARELIKIVQRHPQTRQEDEETKAILAALVHDVGHGPFSHAFEAVGKQLKLPSIHHEDMGDKIIRDGEIAEILKELGDGFAGGVAGMVSSKARNSMHTAVVSSQFDADRLDYMRRDRMMTGSGRSAVDFPWLLQNLEIGHIPFGTVEQPAGKMPTFVVGPKAIHAVEAYILDLFQLYPTVYFHKTTRCAEKIFVELLVRLVGRIRGSGVNGVGLPEKHPLVLFAEKPDDLERYLSLDDAVIWGSLPQLKDSKDPLISEFAGRLLDRKLYKCIDIRTRVQHEIDPENRRIERKCLRDKIDRICQTVKEKLEEIKEDGEDSGSVPEILIDDDERSAYKVTGEDKGPQDRIHIRTEGGELLDLKQRSEVVAGIHPFKLLRAYHRGPKGKETIDDVVVNAIKRDVSE